MSDNILASDTTFKTKIFEQFSYNEENSESLRSTNENNNNFSASTNEKNKYN